MYEYCRNCGKQLQIDGREKVFCNRQCWKEWCEKQRQAEREAAAQRQQEKEYLTRRKTPAEQCKKCRYGCGIGDLQGCGYFDDPRRHSRHFLHPGGLPDECQEFEPRKRGRPKKT